MDFSPQLLGPVIVALIAAAGGYILMIKKIRDELGEQTRRALETFREKTETSSSLASRAGNNFTLTDSCASRCAKVLPSTTLMEDTA